MFYFIFMNSIVVLSALESRIFNGHPLRPEVHGYLVDLELQVYRQQDIVRSKCSGSIVINKWIITSAHCFEQRMRSITVLQDTAKGTRHLGMVKPSMVVKHPFYIDNNTTVANRQYDIALMRTMNYMRVNKYIRRIELATFPPQVGQMAIIAGYGDTELGQHLPREGPVKIIECPYAVENLLCSFDRVRAGNADSGGALTSKGKLVGIISASCTRAASRELEKCITVYANVAANNKWIWSIVRRRQ